MNMFFAAATGYTDNEGMFKTGNKFVLWSYHYYKKPANYKYMVNHREGTILFLDSGAYSAFTLGIPIDIDEYCDFIKELKPDLYASLDAIPVRKEGQSDKEMGKIAGQISFDNYHYMREKGLAPMPVFHQGESIEHLDAYLDDPEVTYLALGGLVGTSNGPMIQFLDKVWFRILSKRPELKTHAFGVTAPEVLLRYPFYSCDSSSWNQASRYARISIYSRKHMKFFPMELAEYCRAEKLEWGTKELETDQVAMFGVAPTRNIPISGDFRIEVIYRAAREYLRLAEHMTEIHEDKDFSYLSKTINLF